MSIHDLKIALDKAGVNPELYSLDGTALPDRVILNHNYHIWEVFYFSERGTRFEEKEFKSEDDACNYLYSLLTNYSNN